MRISARASGRFSLLSLLIITGCSGYTSSVALPGNSPATASNAALNLSIQGPTALDLAGMSAQLTASTTNGADQAVDVTGAVAWSVDAKQTAQIDGSGRLTCLGVGSLHVGASLQSVTVQRGFTCSDRLASIQLSQQTASVRIGMPLKVSASATTVSGRTIDITGQGTWSSSNPLLAVSSSGVVSCNAAGVAQAVKSFVGVSQSISVACGAASWNTPSYFTETDSEFIGPFATWANVKAQFGAVGDGRTDDTKALQAAIDSFWPQTNTPVIWLPRGTYLINKTLLAHNRQFFSIVGEDPQNTTIKWIGDVGGTMLEIAGSTNFRVSRVSLDGSGLARIAERVTNANGGVYSTFNEFSDQHIQGTQIGIDLDIDAETTIQRVFFDKLPLIGVSLDDWNTLNIFIDNSLFLDCGAGVANTMGAGNFIVSNSFFARSTVADMNIGNTGYFTARHNTSMSSKAFFVAGAIGANPAQITLQNNTVLDSTTSPVMLGDQGPLMLIDNVFRMSNTTIPTVKAFYDSSTVKSVFSFGNTYTSSIPPQSDASNTFQGEIYSADDVVVDPSQIGNVTIPNNVYVPPNRQRHILEVSGTATGADIQNKIDDAAANGYVNAVIHIPVGVHHVNTTLTIPPSTPLTLIGDDFHMSSLVWDSHDAQPVIEVKNPDSNIKYLYIDKGSGVRPEGIRIDVYDQPGTHVLIDQAYLDYGNDIAVDFDMVEHANAELFSGYAAGYVTGVKVTGGTFRKAGLGTFGTTNFYTGSLGSTASSTSFDVSAHGKFLVQDNWHDGGMTGPRNFRLSGSGTVTEQVGVVAMSSSQGFELDAFDGKMSLIGLQFNGGFLVGSGPFNADLLTLGLIGESPNYLPTATAGLTIKNVFNAYYNAGGHQIAQVDAPNVAWMRSMLAQTRTEYPVKRTAMTDVGHRTRVERVEIFDTTTAIHLVPATIASRGTYTLSNGSGVFSPFAIDTTLSCQVSSPVSAPITDAGWRVLQNDEGDFVFENAAGTLAMGLRTDANGVQSLTMYPVGTGYEQRWRVENLGDGTLALWNRATNTALSRSLGQCPAMSSSTVENSSRWSITAN